MLTMDRPQGEIQVRDGMLTVGMVVSNQLHAGLLVDGTLVGPMYSFPDAEEDLEQEENSLLEYHTEALIAAICELTVKVAAGRKGEVTALGVALPGFVRNGVVEEAPNLPQLKGARMGEMLAGKLRAQGIDVPVTISNDGDATAAGLAAMHDKLDQCVRVWTLGTGIGYGIYPPADGIWEGGHTVVSLDERENYCGCGGKGHLEGIMGHRAMRLRFLDMEPEEVFAAATRKGNPDPRCAEFRHLWHRALAAATASSIHNSGAGRFFITGYNIRFLDLKLLLQYMHDMVKMSSLQNYQMELVEDDQSVRVIGAGVLANQVLVPR